MGEHWGNWQDFDGHPWIINPWIINPHSHSPLHGVRVSRQSPTSRLSLLHHPPAQGEITQLKISPDQSFFVTAGADGKVRRWNFQGQLLGNLSADTGQVQALAISPDGKRLAIATNNPENPTLRVRIWTLQGQLLDTFDNVVATDYNSFQFTTDGQKLLVGSKILHWSAQQPAVILNRASVDEQVLSVRNSTTLASTQTSQRKSRVSLMQFSGDGQRLAVVRMDGKIQVFDTQGRILGEINCPGIRMVWLNSKGDRLLLSGDDRKTSEIYDLQGKRRAVLQGSPPFQCMDGNCTSTLNPFSPDGKLLWTAGVADPSKPNTNQSMGADRIPDWTVQVPNTIRLWNTDGNLLSVIPSDRPVNNSQLSSRPYQVQTAAFGPQSDRIVVANSEGQIQVRNLQGQPIAQFNTGRSFLAVAFSANGDRIVTTEDETPKNTLSRFFNFFPSIFGVHSSVTTLHSFRVWDLQGRQVNGFSNVFPGGAASFDPIENVTSGVSFLADQLQNFRQHRIQLAPGGWMRVLTAPALPFSDSSNWQTSAQGDRIATLLNDGSNNIRVWDEYGNAIAQYEGYAMALSPDGRSIVVVSAQDHIPRIWRVDDVDGLIGRGCRWLDLYAYGTSEADPIHQICAPQN